MEYTLIVADAVTGHPLLADGTPQILGRGVMPFRQRLPDKDAALALKDAYMARFPRAQVEIESVDGAERLIFTHPLAESLETIARDADAVEPEMGEVFRKVARKIAVMRPADTADN